MQQDLNGHDHNGSTTSMDTSSSSNNEATSIYANVIHKKEEGDSTLTDTAFCFQPSADLSSINTISWSSISKHQVSPASHSKALLKLLFTDGKSTTFQFPSQTELERIRKDVNTRLQRYRTVHPDNLVTSAPRASLQRQSSATLSGQKRRHPEFRQSPMIHGKTTATSFGELDATALAVTRSSLLAANPSLRAQHHYLVEETKTVSEDDFWNTHQDLLEEEYARISGMTRAGTSSLLQSHLQLLTGRVTLGVEEMRQIFILYPAVHKAYEEKVPLELSDEQFWRKYLESEYFHRDRGRVGAASRRGGASGEKQKNGINGNKHTVEEQEARAAAVGTDDIFSRYDQKLKANMETDNGGRKWGTKLAVGQFDLASTYETERGNILEGPKDNYPPNPNDDGKGYRVIQKYNRHWAMVLHPEEAVAGSNLTRVARKSVTEVLSDDEDAKAGGGEDEDMKRLVGFAASSSADANHALGKGLENSDEYEELTLKNVEAYYSGRPAAKDSSMNAPDEETRKRNAFFATSMVAKVNALAASVRDCQQGTILEDAFPPPNLGRDLLMALTNKMAEDSKTDADALEVVKSLPEDFKKRLHSYFRRSSELLRHFFGLRRLAEAQGGGSYTQKLQRIVQGMETVYREMEGMRRELGKTKSGEIMQIMQKMCLQIMEQLDSAFKLHREGSGSGGGGGFVAIEEF
jgi:transcription initiation factor TFIIH subunit 1